MPDDRVWDDLDSSRRVTAPTSLRVRAKRFPLLGTLKCSHDRLVAGTWEEITLDYTVGASGIADGAIVTLKEL